MKWPAFSVHFAGSSICEATFDLKDGVCVSHHSSFLAPADLENLAKLTREMHSFLKLAEGKVEPIDWMAATLMSCGIGVDRTREVIIVDKEDWLKLVGSCL